MQSHAHTAVRDQPVPSSRGRRRVDRATRPQLSMSDDQLFPARLGRELMAMPFDALRLQYANAVMAGLVRRSILVSGELERAVDALEKLALGPLARQR
jgi:hypothetical protein